MSTNEVGQIALGLNHVSWLQEEYFGNPFWQYWVSLCYILAAILLPRLAESLISKRFKIFVQKTKNDLGTKFLELLCGPLKLVLFIILMYLGIKPIHKPDWMTEYLNHGFGIIVAIAITYACVKAVDLGFEWMKIAVKGHSTHYPILILIRKVTKGFVIVIAILVTAENNGIKIGGILASLGVTGLAIALAAQETVSNFLGSIVVLTDHLFSAGDHVKIADVEGIVEHIGIRSTRLRTSSGHMIIVPNRTVATSVVYNYTKTTTQPPTDPS